MSLKILILLVFCGVATLCFAKGDFFANFWNAAGMFFICLYGFIICELCQKSKPDWSLEVNVLLDTVKALIIENEWRNAIFKETLKPSKKETAITLLHESISKWVVDWSKEKSEAVYFDLAPFIYFADPARVQKALDLIKGDVCPTP